MWRRKRTEEENEENIWSMKKYIFLEEKEKDQDRKTKRYKYEKAMHRTQKASRRIPIEVNDPSKPSHRWTKTIEKPLKAMVWGQF